MRDEAAQQGLIGGDGEQRLLGTLAQGIRIGGRKVGQRIHLGMSPDQFDGVEFGRVAREQVDMDAMPMLGEPVRSRSAAVGGQAVPDEIHRPPEMAAQLLQEVLDRFPIVVGVRQEAEVDTHTVTPGRDGERGDHRHLAPRTAALGQHRGHAARRPAAPHEGGHQEARFVAEDERRAPAGRVFFTRGQSTLRHWRIAASSRSRARRAGFCGLQPRPRNSRPM